MKKLAFFLHLIDMLSEWSGRITGYAILVMIGALTYEVVARYAFNSPTKWAHETTLFLYGACGILAGAYTLRHKGHVTMDVLYNRLSPRAQAIVDVVTSAFFFLFLGMVLWKGEAMAWLSLQRLEHTASPWGPPAYPVKMVIPVAASLMLLQGAAKFIRDLFMAIRGRQLS